MFRSSRRRLLFLALGMAPAALAAAPVAAQSAPRGEILWDTYGVAHVYAKSEEGVFYGFGAAQAQSHANAILHLYGEARGRAAEYWGQEFEDQDRWLIANSVWERAGRWYRQQTPQFRKDLDAFARGINDYAARHPDQIDPQVRRVLPVTGVDIVAHAHRLMNYVYVASPSRVMGDVSAEIAMAESRAIGGSNAWAVAPSRSASGNAMLLANPHLPWATGYFRYYEIQLNGPGIDLYGATQIGLPIVRFAFNQNLAFTNTVNGMLGATVYDIKPSGQGYLFDGKTLPFASVSRTYKVRQPGGALVSRTMVVRSTVHGPVFDRKDGTMVALRVAGLDRPFMLKQYLDMGKAQTFKEFEAAVRTLQVPTFNIVYADRAGHILYLDNGVLPKHASGDLNYWSKVVPGDRSETLWNEVHGYDDLPKVQDPTTGFVQNANDAPWLATWPTPLDPAKFPAYAAPLGPMSQRAQMSVKLLANGPKIGFDDFLDKKLTTRSLMADRMVPELVAAVGDDPDPDLREAVALLKRWDHRFEAGSRGALLFETWGAMFAGPRFLGQDNYAIRWNAADPLETPRGLKDPKAAVAMLRAAVAETRKRYGALDRPFGEVSRFQIGDVSLPGNGGFGNAGVFRTITWGPLKDGVRVPQAGETWISMVEFSTPMKAVGVLSYGNSSQPGSKHQNDQLRFMSDKTFRTLWTTRPEVEAHLEETVRF